MRVMIARQKMPFNIWELAHPFERLAQTPRIGRFTIVNIASDNHVRDAFLYCQFPDRFYDIEPRQAKNALLVAELLIWFAYLPIGRMNEAHYKTS